MKIFGSFSATLAIVALAACAPSTRSVSAKPVVEPTPVAQTASTDSPAAPSESADKSPVKPRVVLVEEVARAKLGSAAAHQHDHKNFNRAAYLADPAGYLGQIAGSRIYDVANPAAGLDALAPVGPSGFSVATNTEATLAARTEPGMPVTFTSFGLGQFPASGMQTVTVAADDQGIARAQFLVNPGTVGSCLITAGSPVVSSTIQYLISIPE